MRISHKRKKEEPKKLFFFNEGIVAPQVMVLNPDGQNLGTMTTAAAIRVAREEYSMDLVEINPKAEPPVAKIMNFGQFRYQQEKEARIRKAHQHVVDIKCIRLTLRIGENDLNIRKTQAIKFLEEGNKVKIEIVLRGREMQQGARAFEQLKEFTELIKTTVSIRFDTEPERQGNKVIAQITKN